MNGRAHLGGNLLVAGAGVAAAAVYTPELLPSVTIGLALGIIGGPDVRDQEHVRNAGEWVVTHTLGRTLGHLWTAYWWPLAKALPHRSRLSHAPLLSTLIALLYLTAPPLTAYWLLVDTGQGWWQFMASWALQRETLGLYMGWAAQDINHWLLDL